MNEHDLFTAIGSTEDTFLLELEQPCPHRIPRRFGVIAAMLALLLTACAAPAVIRSFQNLQTGNIVPSDKDIIEIISYDGSGVPLDKPIYFSNCVALEVTVDPEAPETIEEYYFPLNMLELFNPESYTESGNVVSMEFSTENRKYGKIYGILYQQHTLPRDGKITVENILDIGDWEQTTKNYGNVSVLEIFGSGWFKDSTGHILLDGIHVVTIPTKYIFWSDGMYLYCLKIPKVYALREDSAIEELLTSLTPVEDITQYLPTAE